MLKLSTRRTFQTSPSLNFGFAGIRATLQKSKMNRELNEVNNWVHFIPKAEMDKYTLDSYKLAFMSDIADGSLWSLAGQYEGEEHHLYETRIRGREGYGFMSASRNAVAGNYNDSAIRLPDPLSLTQKWVPAENKDGHVFNKYNPYRKPTDDPNPNLKRLKMGFQDKMQAHQVWDLMRPYRVNDRRFTHNKYIPNPLKLYYFNGHLGHRGTSWDHQSYIDNQNNWKPLTQHEQTAHKERAEIKLRNSLYFDKLRFHPKNFKHFKNYVTDAQYARAFTVVSIPYFLYETDRTLSDGIKINRIKFALFLIAFYLLCESFESGDRRQKWLPIVDKYGPHYKNYKYSNVSSEDMYGRDQNSELSWNRIYTTLVGLPGFLWYSWHYEKREFSDWKKLHSFTDADFREDFKYVIPHDWKQNFMNYQVGHVSDLDEKYGFKDDLE